MTKHCHESQKRRKCCRVLKVKNCCNKKKETKIAIKEWVEMYNERIDFSKFNKSLVEHVVGLYSMCYNKRCEVLHDPEVQKQCSMNEIKAIKEEARR